MFLRDRLTHKSGHPSRSSQTGRTDMNCLTCKDLDRALASWRSKAIEARSAAYYRVSTELAARINVDMERAKNGLEEHRSVCKAYEKGSMRRDGFLLTQSESRAVQLRQFLDRRPSRPGSLLGISL